MAAIDHTVIVFKNGEYMKHPYTFDEEDNYINLCPFKYGRDGNITEVCEKFGVSAHWWRKIHDDIKWYRDEYDAVYERDGWRDWCTVRKTPHGIWSWLKYRLRFMYKIGYRKEVGVWRKDGVEVYIYHDQLKQANVSFYSDGTDTYIVIGGYGHHENVYCHFMGRGYGDEFEEKMAAEAFRWACNTILVDISESICESWEAEEDFVNDMWQRFGYDEEWYKIVDREE